jgi:hypothetical protein
MARPLFGARLLPADYVRTSGIVIRGIGLASLFAFVSWWWQAAGLIGSQGIEPVRDYFDAAHAPARSVRVAVAAVVVLAFESADWMTTALCGVGTAASVLLILRVWPALASLIACVCYLSLEYGGGVFLEVSVGHSAGRVADRRGRAQPSAARRHLADAPAGVSLHIPVRRREAGIREPTWRDLSAPRLPFRIAAVADGVCVVRRSPAAYGCIWAPLRRSPIELLLPFLISRRATSGVSRPVDFCCSSF